MPLIRMDRAAVQAIIYEDSLNPFETTPGPCILWLSSLFSNSIFHGFPGGFAFEDLGELFYGAEMGETGFGVFEGAVGGFRGYGQEWASG